MVEFEVFLKRMNNIGQFIDKRAGDILMKQENKILSYQKAQLKEGTGNTGQIMQRGYSSGYANKRRKAGLQTSFVDLKFSGNYQDSMKGKKADGGMNIQSGVSYEKYLRGNFPTHIGLDKDNSEAVAELIAPEVAKEIKNYLIK